MKIGISTRGLRQGSHAISNIIHHLTQNIIHLAPGSHQINLYFNDPNLTSLFTPVAKTRSIRIKNRLIWDHVWLPVVLKKDRVDITLFFKGTMPFLLPSKGAVIFNDLGYFDTQLKPYRFFETLYMKRMMAWAGEKADVIFAISEYTRKEAIKILGIDEQKIKVCYPNCSPIFKPGLNDKSCEQVRSFYHLPQQFIFCPVNLSPRKNLPRILKAFKEVKDLLPHHLVITGGQSWGASFPERSNKTVDNDRIHLLGNVQLDHMPVLYKMASFMLYPSLLEGFGIPILEAFNCGCPVLTSNITSMPEVAGNAAILVDPYDTRQIADGITRLAFDGDLRADLIQKGFERARFFSWEKAAGAILDGLGIKWD